MFHLFKKYPKYLDVLDSEVELNPDEFNKSTTQKHPLFMLAPMIRSHRTCSGTIPHQWLGPKVSFDSEKWPRLTQTITWVA